MAVSTTHGVDAEEIVDLLPYDTSYVTSSTSEPLRYDLVDEWVQRASGILNAMMESKGVDPTDLSEDAEHIVASSIEAYVRARCLSKLPDADNDETRAAYSEWEDGKKIVKKDIQALGAESSVMVHSNIDTDDPTRREWGSKNFTGW